MTSTCNIYYTLKQQAVTWMLSSPYCHACAALQKQPAKPFPSIQVSVHPIDSFLLYALDKFHAIIYRRGFKHQLKENLTIPSPFLFEVVLAFPMNFNNSLVQ